MSLSFHEIAPGLATVASSKWQEFNEQLWRKHSIEKWLDAFVDDPHQGAIVDTTYRRAKVIGEAQNPDLIAALEVQAKAASWPYLVSLGSFYDALQLSGSQLVRYEPGGFFRPHRDAGRQYRNRCFTVLNYLSSCEGGETVFPELGISVKPEPGLWLVFFSEYLHAAQPVLAGEKLIFVTWAVNG